MGMEGRSLVPSMVRVSRVPFTRADSGLFYSNSFGLMTTILPFSRATAMRQQSC